MTILEKIDFEEEWLSEVNLSKENMKIAFAGIRATVRESQQVWISCDEKLPEETEYVLLYYERDSWKNNKCFRIKDIDKGWHIDGLWHVDGVSGVKAIAWMPLPIPFEEDSHD